MIVSGGWGAAEARADVWHTSLGREITGGLTSVIPMSGWSLRGFLGKSEPDPLTLAEPGSGSGGFLLGRSVYSSETERGARRRGPFEILSESGGRTRVRITVEAPDDSGVVVLLGDFTLWDPVPMRREGRRWMTEVEVAEGTHHYGFLVDDETTNGTCRTIRRTSSRTSGDARRRFLVIERVS